MIVYGFGVEPGAGPCPTDACHLFFSHLQLSFSSLPYLVSVFQAVIENSKTRGSLKEGDGFSAGNSHEIQKVQTASGLVMASNPVAIVVSPRLVQVVERTTGEVLNKVFIKNIPFTLEAPGRADG